MSAITDSIGATVGVITAMGALGTAAFGLVDASKAFGGGASRYGLKYVFRALKPYEGALHRANSAWRLGVEANWINGVDKAVQKDAVKTLIRLGLRSSMSEALAAAGGVDPTALHDAMIAIETGHTLTPQQADVFGRFNAVVDAHMDAGFERGDQRYRNAAKLFAAAVSVGLAWWAAYIMWRAQLPIARPVTGALGPSGHATILDFFDSPLFGAATVAGLLAVPIAPIAKDLASSLQAAAKAVTAVDR